MCNLYSMTKGQQAIRDLVRAMKDRTGNLPILPGIFPDYAAPIVREGPEGRERILRRLSLADCAPPNSQLSSGSIPPGNSHYADDRDGHLRQQ